MDDALDVEIAEEGGGKGIVVAIDIDEIMKLAMTEFLKDIGLAHLTGSQEYEGLTVGGDLPSDKFMIYSSFHKM